MATSNKKFTIKKHHSPATILPKITLIIPVLAIIIVLTTIFLPHQQVTKVQNPIDATLISTAHDAQNAIDFQTIKHTKSSIDSTIEYPLTGQEKIDQTLSADAERIYASFLDSVPKNSANQYQQAVEYTYLPIRDQYISVILHETRTSPENTSTKIYPYTFRRDSGEIVLLEQILRDSSILSTYGDEQDIADLLKTSFAIDPESQKLIFTISSATQSLTFEQLKNHIAPSVAREMFGFAFLVDQVVGNVNCAIQKCLALTFDDGPSAHTDRLLDILAQSGAKASFFVLGNRVSSFSGQVSRAVREGHDVGSHSWNHKNLPTFSAGQISQDLTDTTSVIQNTTNQRVRFFRPPYGNINGSVRQATSNLEQNIVLWDIDPRDWQYKNATQVCNHIVNHAAPNRVILLHDIYATSVDAAKCAIDRLSYDYVFVNLSTLYK